MSLAASHPPRARQRIIIGLTAALALSACGAGEDAATQDTTADTTEVTAPSGAGMSATAPTSPSPTEPPTYRPPDDWYEQALDTADTARRAVVAIGWDPPGDLRRRIEAGWLSAPDVVITSHTVACEAKEGRDLRVRTFDGTIVRATIEATLGTCNGWDPGIALVRLERAVDAPTLQLRTGGAPVAGEPLLAIGHANHAAAVGGWLVMVGPMVRTEGDTLLADIGAPVTRFRFDEWFGGGANGAPLIDLRGDVVAVLCCEQDWGPQLQYDDAFAEPVLRSRLTIDSRYHVAGLWGDALLRAVGTAAG